MPWEALCRLLSLDSGLLPGHFSLQRLPRQRLHLSSPRTTGTCKGGGRKGTWDGTPINGNRENKPTEEAGQERGSRVPKAKELEEEAPQVKGIKSWRAWLGEEWGPRERPGFALVSSFAKAN